MHLVIFNLDRQRYALHLSAVERVVRAVQVTPLPKGPPIVLGVVNVRGQIIPVINLRRRFGLSESELSLGDSFVLARAGTRGVALVADGVDGLLELFEKDVVTSTAILPSAQYLEGVVKLNDGLVLIHNLESFLSVEEAQELDGAITEAAAERPT